MAQVLSLKELRTSNVLKAEISRIEEEKAQLNLELERQRQLEKKLRDDLLDQKKDFEHLEKQFEHFAGIESEFEALQQEVQMERLEKLIDGDKKDAQSRVQLKKLRDDLKDAQDELKELRQMDPQRLKRQVTDLKKKSQQQATDNQSLNNALVAARKELKEVTAEKEQLEAELKAHSNGSDFFWQSVNEEWLLYESSIVLNGEDVEDTDNFKRILCLHVPSGTSVLSKGKDDKDVALWLGELVIPEEVSIEAGKRMLSIAAELEDSDDD